VNTSGKRRRHWAIEIKRRIAEESLAGSASVAQVAQKYAVNANQSFLWRKQYREGRPNGFADSRPRCAWGYLWSHCRLRSRTFQMMRDSSRCLRQQRIALRRSVHVSRAP
jgi:transposase-like protein